ncbi:MAG TPA: DNA-processing protein DprA [Moheibacter sp.]|nr:DNA-processing protein DprA [Moheibacter sp.]
MNADLRYLLALTYVPDLGPVNQKKILNLIAPRDLWGLNKNELRGLFGAKKELVQSFLSSEFLDSASREIEFCEQNNIEILSHDSNDFPEKLKHCHDSPVILFKKGNYGFDKKLHIGIVGTRKMTSYGKKFIGNFISEISSQPIAVISGLAYGCDIEAHRESLKNDVTNVAVLGHGLNRISPSSHKKEAREIEANGALLTEYSTFHPSDASNFISRNRIVAGLCDALVVVESDKKGGSLATAAFANSYNREVFAVPGRVEDRFSLGCNDLIQSNQACMIRNADDLLLYFNLKNKPKSIQSKLFVDLDSEEKMIYEILKKKGKTQVDSLSVQTQFPVFKLNGILLNMELKGVIKPLPGKFFEIN